MSGFAEMHLLQQLYRNQAANGSVQTVCMVEADDATFPFNTLTLGSPRTGTTIEARTGRVIPELDVWLRYSRNSPVCPVHSPNQAQRPPGEPISPPAEPIVPPSEPPPPSPEPVTPPSEPLYTAVKTTMC